MINWNGISSDSLNVIVEYIPSRTIARKKINTYSVPGRTGDIIDDEGAFDNYSQKYNIFIEGDEISNLPLRARAVAEWLMAPNGYAVLRDNYDINSFRYAYFQGPLDIGTWFNIHGQAAIEFVCDPHRYLDEGQKEITVSDSAYLINPTAFKAKPLIRIFGTTGGAGTVTLAQKTIQILTISDNMYVDCFTGQAYTREDSIIIDGVELQGTDDVSVNDQILCTDFPVLSKGDNHVSFTGDISSLTIVPRWWTL